MKCPILVVELAISSVCTYSSKWLHLPLKDRGFKKNKSNQKSWKKHEKPSACHQQLGIVSLQKTEVSAAESQGEPPRSILLGNFGADVDPNHLFTQLVAWKSCEHTRLHQHTILHFSTPVGLREAFQKRRLRKWLESWEILRIRLFRSDNRRSGPTSLCHEMRKKSRRVQHY